MEECKKKQPEKRKNEGQEPKKKKERVMIENRNSTPSKEDGGRIVTDFMRPSKFSESKVVYIVRIPGVLYLLSIYNSKERFR